MNKILAIQGDLRFIKAKESRKGKKRKDTVLVYGESTGHKHYLNDGEVYDYGERLLFSVPANTTIVHEEHNPIPFEKGDYEVIRQREYKSSNMTALVID